MKAEHKLESIARRIRVDAPGDRDSVCRLIDTLSHADRKAIAAMLPDDCPRPRNLSYDYKLQCWID